MVLLFSVGEGESPRATREPADVSVVIGVFPAALVVYGAMWWYPLTPS